MDDFYINKKCHLFEAAVVASCDVASLLPAADEEGEERGSSAGRGFPHQQHTEP